MENVLYQLIPFITLGALVTSITAFASNFIGRKHQTLAKALAEANELGSKQLRAMSEITHILDDVSKKITSASGDKSNLEIASIIQSIDGIINRYENLSTYDVFVDPAQAPEEIKSRIESANEKRRTLGAKIENNIEELKAVVAQLKNLEDTTETVVDSSANHREG